MIPHRNPSFLIDKSSPKQIKTPGSPPGVFIWGAAPGRRSHSEPGSSSPLTASMKFSGAALFEACGPAMGGLARQFLPGACPPLLCPPGTSRPRKKAPHSGGAFSIPAGAGSAALLQAVDGKGIEPKALIKPESRFVAIGHTEFPGVRPPPLCPPGTSHPRKKTPHDGRVFFYSGRSRISCASAGNRW